MKKKTVLISGGAGLIGSHLCEKLLNKKNTIICIDNLFTGSKNNLKKFINNKNFIFIKKNINSNIKINLKIDEIYNLACPASPVHYQTNPIETVKTNVIGSINMLELAKKNNAKILQSSTSEIYGNPKISPQKESYNGNVNTIGPRACYDEGKRCAETLFFDYRRQLNLKIKLVRIFNTYGPNMSVNDGRVISNFIVNALNNKPLEINGDGNQTRSFCYIDDLIHGMIKMMNSKITFCGPCNLGNPSEIKIKELAKKIIKITNSKSKIINLRSQPDDPRVRKPNISLAKKELNWKPNISFDRGLLKTIEYFESILKKKKHKY